MSFLLIPTPVLVMGLVARAQPQTSPHHPCRHLTVLLAVCAPATAWRCTTFAPTSLRLTEHRQSSYMPRHCRWRRRTAPRRAPGRAGTRSSTRATGSSRSARRRGARRAAGSPAARRPRRRRPTRPTAVSFAQGAHLFGTYLEAVSASHWGLREGPAGLSRDAALAKPKRVCRGVHR